MFSTFGAASAAPPILFDGTTADTIPAGRRLIIPPGSTARFAPPRRTRSRTTEVADLRLQIFSLVRKHNLLARRLSLREAALAGADTIEVSLRLDGVITLLHKDSSSWAATLAPAPARLPGIRFGRPLPINPDTRTTLRNQAIRNGVGVLEAWRRFPAGPGETPPPAAQPRPSPSDPLVAAAKAAARSQHVPFTLEFLAKYRESVASLSTLIKDLLP